MGVVPARLGQRAVSRFEVVADDRLLPRSRSLEEVGEPLVQLGAGCA
jgi:hypothetical protein